MKIYVVGFVFTENGKNVVLIRKNKPEWQKGLLNGVGGKVELDELPIDAMRREYYEEAGFFYDLWNNFLTVQYKDCIVYFYKAFNDNLYNASQTMELESIHKRITASLPDDIIPNLKWIIPLALDSYINKTNAVQC